MLAKRIIPCLDIKGLRTVKGRNFQGVRDAGDPLVLAGYYSSAGADELVLLNIAASQEARRARLDLVREIARVVAIPFTVGGGIEKLADAEELLAAGADKVSVNTAAVERPALIDELAREFGSQAVVLAIDSKKTSRGAMVCTRGGTLQTEICTLNWAKEGARRGAGEILLTSIDMDGVRGGFDLELCRRVREGVRTPIIASGGAGAMSHFLELFRNSQAEAALAASVFHYGEFSPQQLKQFLNANCVEVRL